MTITATFTLQNVPVNADTVRQAIASLMPNGSGGIIQPGDFTVSQTGTPSMGVSVGVGRAWIEGTDSAHLAGQAYGKQGKYFVLNDAAYTVAIDTADSTNPRIDVIYVAIQDANYAGSNNQAVIAVAKGAPTPGATYPTNAPTLPTNSIAVAWTNVPAGASNIVNSNITTIKNQILTPSSVIPTAGTGWTITGTLDRIPTANGNQVNASVKAIYAGSGPFTVNGNFIVAFTLNNTGYLPSGDAYGYFMLRASGTRAVKADCAFTIDSTGAVYVRTLLGQAATTFAVGDEMDINTVWNVA